MIVKKIAGIAFAIAFIMALRLFGDIGREYISLYNAKLVFMGAGAIGLLLNLFSFQTGKHNPIYSFLYWGGSIILFIGLVFLQFQWPYGFYIIIAGLLILGVSFLIPIEENKAKKNSDLLDN